jgi:hypothetical protein
MNDGDESAYAAQSGTTIIKPALRDWHAQERRQQQAFNTASENDD